MREDAVIIQQASGAYRELLKIGLHRHLCVADRRGFDYWPIFGETRPDAAGRHPYWEKPYLLRQAIEAGYSFIVAIDSDVLIIGEEDLRDALPGEGFGAVWHSREEWGDARSYDHFNIGALYVRVNERVKRFVEAWIAEGDSEHPWHDQHAFHLVRQRAEFAGLVTEMDRRWHSCIPTFPAESGTNPQVLAWHGFGCVAAREHAMDSYLRGRQI